MVRFLFIVCALLILLIPTKSSEYVVPENPQLEEVREVETPTEGIGETWAHGSQVAGKVTMYNSVPEQTDDTPFVTASGTTTRKGIVANNCLAFGTWVVIDDVIYEVQDRMNSKYGCEWFDIWSESVAEAVAYGVQDKIVNIPVCVEDCPLIEVYTENTPLVE